MSSSLANPKYYRTNWMGQSVEADGVSAYDPMSVDIQNYLDTIAMWKPYIWADGDVLTTVAYKAHGTTSTWWLILMYNGLCSLNEMQPGMELRIPDLSDMLAAQYVPAQPKIITI